MFPGYPSICPSVHRSGLSVCPLYFRGITLHTAPAKAMSFRQMFMHALQCQHDVDVHLLFLFHCDFHIAVS